MSYPLQNERDELLERFLIEEEFTICPTHLEYPKCYIDNGEIKYSKVCCVLFAAGLNNRLIDFLKNQMRDFPPLPGSPSIP
jgi:hypothetical protein